jgi:hypothetical protein
MTTETTPIGAGESSPAPVKYVRISTFSAIAPDGTEVVLDQISEAVDENEPLYYPFRPVGMGSGREVHTNLRPSDIAFLNSLRAERRTAPTLKMSGFPLAK